LTYDWETNAGRTDVEADLAERDSALHLKQDGQIAERLHIRDEVIVDGARDAVIRESLLDGGGVYVYEHTGADASVQVDHSDVLSPANGIAGLSVTVRHSYINTGNDGITPTGGSLGQPSLIEYNKIVRDGTQIEDRHHDGIQFWQGGNAVIRRNWISGWHTSAILIKSDRELRPGDGPVSNVLIEDNYLANPTSHWTLYVVDGGHGRPRYITIRNNAFGPGGPISAGEDPQSQAVFVRTERERDDTVAAGNDEAAEWIVWHGNYRADTGEEIVPPGGWLDTASDPG
jgi:hypothetical protein